MYRKRPGHSLLRETWVKYVKISANGKKSAGCQRLLASRAFKIPFLEVVVRLNFFSSCNNLSLYLAAFVV